VQQSCRLPRASTVPFMLHVRRRVWEIMRVLVVRRPVLLVLGLVRAVCCFASVGRTFCACLFVCVVRLVSNACGALEGRERGMGGSERGEGGRGRRSYTRMVKPHFWSRLPSPVISEPRISPILLLLPHNHTIG
jgi:hypothetical protein